MLDIEAYRKKLLEIESSGGQNLVNPDSGAFGPYQFHPKTAKEYGLEFGENQDAAFEDFTSKNREQLVAALEREPTMGELYLAHQQGAKGAIDLLSNPDAPAVAVRPTKAITQNAGTPDMTAGEFANKWMSKFDTMEQTNQDSGLDGMQPIEVNGEVIYFPSDMPDDAIAAVLEKEFPAQEEAATQKPEDFSVLGANIAGAADTASFGLGDEIGAGIGAAIAAPFSDRGFSEIYNDALQSNRAGDAAIKADEPLAYAAGQVGGAIIPSVAGGSMLATKAPTLYKTLLGGQGVTRKVATAGAVGGVSGGLYGLGSGDESAEKRLEQAQTGAAIGSVGGVAGLGVSAALSPVVRRGASLVQRAAKAFGKNADNAVSAADNAGAIAIKQPEANGNLIPLSKGQITQNPEAQALENMARAGAVGRGAAQDIRQFDAKQQEAIRNVMGGMGANADEAATLSGVGRNLQQTYKGAKAGVNQAYDSVNLDGVRVSGQAIREGFAPKVSSILVEGGFDLTSMTPRTQKLVEQAAKIEPNVTEMSLKNMEFWRRKVTNAINDNTDSFGKLNSEGVALSKMLGEYDRFMAKLPEDALKAGDEKALEAINKARGMRRELGVLFERDKAVERIVKTSDLTDEELANMVLTGSKASEKLGTGSGRLIKNMKRAAGEKSTEMVQGLKSGTMARVLRKATGTTQIEGTEHTVIQPAKLRNELDGLLRNKSFVKEVFSPQEAMTLQKLRDDVAKIASEQKGSNNYSNTAYAITQFLRRLSPVKVEGIFESASESVARKDLGLQLQQFADETQRMLAGKAKYYGAAAGGSLASDMGNEDAPTQIMVNPRQPNPYRPAAN